MTAAPPFGFARRLVRHVVDDGVFDLAAAVAYRFLLAIFPFGIFLAALAAFVAAALGIEDPTGRILDAIGGSLPPDIAAQIAPQLEAVLGHAQPGLLSIGAIGALWAATGGITALQKAMNAAYEVPETRSFLVRTGNAVALTILGCAGILAAFVIIVGGSVVSAQAVRALGVPDTAWSAISLVRWPIVLALVALATAILLRFAPNVAVSFRWALVGGAVFAAGWLIATVLFGLYIANFGHYSNTYGALGGVVVLMLWFYLTAVMLLLAAEVTSLLVKDREPHRIAGRRGEIARRADQAAQPRRVAGAPRAGESVGAAAAGGTTTAPGKTRQAP